jgi:PAT family beta-lactamase induction signal transducer AmpG
MFPPIKNNLKLICNERFLVMLCQGIASGLPIAIIGSTLQAWFAVSGISVIAIGTLSLVGQPYVYKFLWAPLLDRYTLPFLGRRRGWMFVTQLCLTCAIALLAFLAPLQHIVTIGILAFIIATISASQDIVIDAYRTEFFPATERGLSVTFYTTGYRIATIISSAGALILADSLGWHNMFLLMAAIMLGAAAITLFLTKESSQQQQPQAPTSLRHAVILPLQNFWQRPAIIAILLFVVLYKFTDAFALSLGSKFLIDLGFSLTNIGTIYKGVGIFATLLGTFCAGLLMLRISLFAALLWFGILQALSNLTFAWLALVGKNLTALTIAVFSENFCSGLGTVAFLVFIMSLCDKRFTATQYAILSALAMVGRTYIGPLAGQLAQHLQVSAYHSHWAIFYFYSFIAAIPSFVLLYYLRNYLRDYVTKNT